MFIAIDPIGAEPQGGNHGPEGWAFTAYSNLPACDAPYRRGLEAFVRSHPQSHLSLPNWEEDEDFVQGSLTWEGQRVEIYFEVMVLSFLKFWSADRSALESLRAGFVAAHCLPNKSISSTVGIGRLADLVRLILVGGKRT
jgi:hypothetical protein